MSGYPGSAPPPYSAAPGYAPPPPQTYGNPQPYPANQQQPYMAAPQPYPGPQYGNQAYPLPMQSQPVQPGGQAAYYAGQPGMAYAAPYPATQTVYVQQQPPRTVVVQQRDSREDEALCCCLTGSALCLLCECCLLDR